MPKQKQQGRAAKAKFRQPRVFDMYMRGLTYRQIAEDLTNDEEYPGSVSHTTIAKDVNTYLDRLDKQAVKKKGQLKRMQLERISQAIQGLWNKVMGGEPPAVLALVRLMEREAKLEGLDAPAKIDIEHRIREMAREHGLDEEEAVREAERVTRAASMG